MIPKSPNPFLRSQCLARHMRGGTRIANCNGVTLSLGGGGGDDDDDDDDDMAVF